MRPVLRHHLLNLHSIMYLLIQFAKLDFAEFRQNLHSIMYLLIRLADGGIMTSTNHLHSIMYLLIRCWWYPCIWKVLKFTFHNVSINSLITKQITGGQLFTFHNVSINSNEILKGHVFLRYLHSIMYLLIR